MSQTALKDCLVNFFMTQQNASDTVGSNSFVYATQLGQGCEVSTWRQGNNKPLPAVHNMCVQSSLFCSHCIFGGRTKNLITTISKVKPKSDSSWRDSNKNWQYIKSFDIVWWWIEEKSRWLLTIKLPYQVIFSVVSKPL